MIDLVLNNFTTDRAYTEEFFRKILEETVEKADIEAKRVELSVNLVGEGRIKALNKKYRGRNRVTDVLSFPLQTRTGADYTRTYADKTPRHRKPGGLAMSPNLNPHGIMSLGDIFICLPVAKKHAQREGVSLDSKMAFLTIHGFLHLLGYDHEKTEDRNKMFEMQDEILNKLSSFLAA